MVMAVILFMGAVSGAHLNPAVSVAFALRGDFPWRRVPLYVVAQFAGAVLATLLLIGLIGKQGSAGLTLPGPGISTLTAFAWEILLTTGLVSVVLGTASGAQQLGPVAAFGVGSYIALAGLFGAPVSGASMNPVRSLGPALVLGDWTSWWAYLAGPLAGALIAAGFAYVLARARRRDIGHARCSGNTRHLVGPGTDRATAGSARQPAARAAPRRVSSRKQPGPGPAARALADGLAGAADAGRCRRPGGKPLGRDQLAATLAASVTARGQPGHRRVDPGQLPAGLIEQGRDVLPLERDRGALGIVLVVGVGLTGRLDNRAEVALQC